MSQVTEKKIPETKLEENVRTHSHLNKSRVKAVTEDQNSNFSSGPQDQLNLGKWATCGNLQQRGGWGALPGSSQLEILLVLVAHPFLWGRWSCLAPTLPPCLLCNRVQYGEKERDLQRAGGVAQSADKIEAILSSAPTQVSFLRD